MSEGAVPPVIDFVETSTRMRATHYREEAARFRSLAEAEPLAVMRRHLVRLARLYDGLASELRIDGR